MSLIRKNSDFKTKVTLPPGQKGTIKMYEKYGGDLFCVRYRYNKVLGNGLQERCSTIVIGELDFSPQVHNQLIGRLDREGQLNPVMAIFLVSDSGSDPLIVDLLGLKSSQAQGVIDPHLGVQQIHSDDSRIQLLIQKYLKSKGHVTAPVVLPVMAVPTQNIEQMQFEGM